MFDLVLIGGGGHCNSVIDVISNAGDYRIKCIVEKKREDLVERNYPYVFGDEKMLEYIKIGVKFFITIGQIKSPAPRERVFKLIDQNGGEFATIRSKHAYVSQASQIGEGTFIGNGAIVNCNVDIGKNCIINTKALLEHDVSVGSHCHISTSAVVNGSVQIGNRVFVGSGAVINNNVKIGGGSIIGAGAVVKHDVSPNSLVI